MKAIFLGLVALAIPLVPQIAEGRQYTARNGQVVHTRRAPVIMHRIVPPFKGVHVYEGRARR